MDVNSTILQLPSPTAASPSEGAAPRTPEVKSPSSGKPRKTFAAALRTAQQREDKGRPQQSDDMESRRAAKSDARSDQGKPVRDDAARSHEIEGRGRDAKTERLSQNQTDQSDDKEDRGQDEGALETSAPFDVVRELGQLGQVVASLGAPVTSSDMSTDDPGQATNEDGLLRSSENNAIAGISAAPVLVTAEPEESVTATTEETGQAPALPQGTSVSLVQQNKAASATQPMQETHDAPSGQLLDPRAEPRITVVDHETREQGGAPAQQSQNEKQAAPVQPTAEGGKQASAVSQELSRLDAAGPQLARRVEPPVQQNRADVAVQSHRELHSPPSSPDASGEERAGKSMVIEPHGLRAVSDSGQHSDFLWSNQDERQSAFDETPRAAHAPMAPSQPDPSGDHSDQAITVGNAAPPQPRPADSRSTQPSGAASSATPAHDLEPFIPTMSRSVAFEVAGPDLGRIHIRVAMTNELVHAHLSSDRSEIGQFLINGQDRLQSALQSNGLEMGQFRVDIDRQSAGRSFQQGPPQDQSRMWQQASNGDLIETGFFERHEAAGLSHAGRLNVVA